MGDLVELGHQPQQAPRQSFYRRHRGGILGTLVSLSGGTVGAVTGGLIEAHSADKAANDHVSRAAHFERCSKVAQTGFKASRGVVVNLNDLSKQQQRDCGLEELGSELGLGMYDDPQSPRLHNAPGGTLIKSVKIELPYPDYIVDKARLERAAATPDYTKVDNNALHYGLSIASLAMLFAFGIQAAKR
jgi:hypothetical protein